MPIVINAQLGERGKKKYTQSSNKINCFSVLLVDSRCFGPCHAERLKGSLYTKNKNENLSDYVDCKVVISTFPSFIESLKSSLIFLLLFFFISVWDAIVLHGVTVDGTMLNCYHQLHLREKKRIECGCQRMSSGTDDGKKQS